MKPVDLVKLIATGTAGVIVVGFKLLSTAVVNPVLAFVSLASLIGYGCKVFFGYKQSKDRYQSLVTRSLYDKSLDNDRGVIFALVDALEQQEVKESLIAYFYLWQNGPKTEDELDAIAERFLLDDFGVEVDFEVDDAIEKLVELDLVQPAGELPSADPALPPEPIWRAVPIDLALIRLSERWARIFGKPEPVTSFSFDEVYFGRKSSTAITRPLDSLDPLEPLPE